MANKRIKDLGTTASTLAADDYVAIDGNANGTRKIVKGDLVNDISTQVAGTYLDEANNLSDVASKDTSKLNLEVPNVGVSPNEVPLSGQLGTMAFQDSAGVSVGQLEADDVSVGNVGSGYSSVADELIVGDEDGSAGMTIVSGSGNSGNLFFADGTTSSSQRAAGKISFTHGADILQIGTVNTTAITIDSDQKVGIGTASPGSYNSAANNLVVGSEGGNKGATIVSGTASVGYLFFADGTGANAYRGRVAYDHASDQLYLGASGTSNWKIDGSTGNLIAIQSGNGINFGVVPTSGPSPSSSTLSDYEEGSFTPVFADDVSGGNTATVADAQGIYAKIGRVVSFSILLTNIDTTGLTAGNPAYIRGLPFDFGQTTVRWSGSVRLDSVTFSGYVTSNGRTNVSVLHLNDTISGAGDTNLLVSAFTSGSADVFITGTYQVG